jgi:hypothetical protein
MKNSKKNWTEEDLEYLYQRWGEVSVPSIAKKLGRSEMAVILKAQREGLGSVLDSGEAVSLSQLVTAIKGNNSSYSSCYEVWVKKYGLPVHKKRVRKNTFRVVYLEEFWEWAEKHRSIIDFSKMEPFILGVEPEWVSKQRKNDFLTKHKQKFTPWTEAEDAKLKYLVSQQRHTYDEISKDINRSVGAITRRLIDLGIKERPLRADNSKGVTKWTNEHFIILTDSIKNGESFCLMSEKIGKSEKAIRGKAYYDYLTEDIDKIREMIKDGKWGDNMPSPTVKQAKFLSRSRRECRERMRSLVNILQKRADILKGGINDGTQQSNQLP